MPSQGCACKEVRNDWYVTSVPHYSGKVLANGEKIQISFTFFGLLLP